MDMKPGSTRESILAAAGPLFAENGLRGVSTRTLSERADVNLASINYYFGSKEELFIEAVKIAADCCRIDLPEDFLTLVEKTNGRPALTELLDLLIDSKVTAYLNLDHTEDLWKRRLMMRVFMKDDHMLPMIVHELRLEHEAQVQLFQKLNPELTDLQAHLAVFSMTGQLAYYVFARTPALALLQKEDFTDDVVTALKSVIYSNLKELLKL